MDGRGNPIIVHQYDTWMLRQGADQRLIEHPARIGDKHGARRIGPAAIFRETKPAKDAL